MAMKPIRKRLGIREEVIAAHVQEFVAKAKSGQLA
jgi:hypothetical protein